MLRGGAVVSVPSKVISRLSRLEELYLQCEFGKDDADAAQAEEEFNLSFHEFLDLKCLTILKVNITSADSLPKNIGFYPNWVKFNISFCRKSLAVEYGFADLFSDDYSRALTLDTTITTLPAWFIEAVTKKTEKLQYVEGSGLSDIVVEHDHERLQCLKYLSLLRPDEELNELMNTTRVPPNEPVFENLEVLYVYLSCLKELCVGELPNGSLCKLKMLKVQVCKDMVNALVPSNLLHRLHNLETLICVEMEGLEYVFGTEGLEPEQIVLITLRQILLSGLSKLMKIWDGPAPSAIFRNLNFLTVSGCNELKTLLTFDVAEFLLQLEHLWVDDCSGLERVIEPSGEREINKVLVLPKLNGIVLKDLPQLTGFYSSTTGSSTIDHIECPSLEHLYVEKCPQFSSSASDFHSRNQVQLSDYIHFLPLSERWFKDEFRNLRGFKHERKRSDSSIGF